ncbi:MAG: hypothetical protein NUV55_04780 [Sulfuricaulis sp.]|uniref:hypothetical protein n=1 Tax=Sulfuricaulis sp. TaxID=2003553 RepID=UPI0025CE3115|nr:hypothetical protein [Sulfuricaulis sp.]MCR4346502.1 hypothetical protein [Sulfuricaulis sp.]
MNDAKNDFLASLDDDEPAAADAPTLADMLGLDTPESLAVDPFANFFEQPSVSQPEQPRELAALPDLLDEDVRKALDELDPQEFAFLSSYMEHGVAARAARAAGYAYENPLARNRRLQIALAHIRRSLATKLSYGIRETFTELNDAMQFSKDNKSPIGLVRCIEIKSKIAGHLQDHKVSGEIRHKHEHTITDTRTDDELRAHAAQLARDLGMDKSNAIDAEVIEVKK